MSRVLAVVLTGGVALSSSVGVAWYIDENVFRLPGLLGALVVPAALGSAAFLITLVALARRDREGVGVALAVLGSWLLVCPLFVAAGAWVSGTSNHHVMQAAVRGVVAVVGAAWLLLRASARSRTHHARH